MGRCKQPELRLSLPQTLVLQAQVLLAHRWQWARYKSHLCSCDAHGRLQGLSIAGIPISSSSRGACGMCGDRLHAGETSRLAALPYVL